MVATVCPACGHRPHIRNSRPLTQDVYELYLKCLNPDCGCVFVAFLENVRIVGESMLPSEKRGPSYEALPRSHEQRLTRYQRHLLRKANVHRSEPSSAEAETER